MLIGLNITTVSAMITTKQYNCYYNFQGDNPVLGECRGPGPSMQGAIMAAMPAGAWLSTIIMAWFLDGNSSKLGVQCSAGFWISGSLFITFSDGVPLLIVGRFINGISVGLCVAQLPVYISEISPVEVRGRFLGMYQWAITWGMAVMFFISLGCNKLIASDMAFRLPWGLQLIPAALLLLGLHILPENPRWLADTDRWHEAREVFTLIHGRGNYNAPIIMREMSTLLETLRERDNANVSWFELMEPNMLNRTHIGLFTQIWSQLTGRNVMVYYITYVFLMAGVHDLAVSSIVFFLYAVVSIPGLIWVGRMGRRPTMLVGALLMCFLMSLNAGLFARHSQPITDEDHPSTGGISMSIRGWPATCVVASAYFFAATYALTWGRASWTYPPEIYPPRVRSKMVALSTSAGWVLDFAVAYFTPIAFATITWKTYVIFAVFCGCGFIHCFFLFPETANKSSEEVAAIFTDDGPGSIKYIGTPAWKRRNDRRGALQRENDVVDPETNGSPIPGTAL
ncbi:high-affinity glucose transporter [Xylaria telfairii]|nr:high-affinity glucose transporter [Xylaria telfairii]